MTGVSNVSAGVADFSDDHFLVVKSDGTLWAWGNNYYGQLGDGTTKSSSTPKQIMTGVSSSASSIGVGYYYSLAVKTDGTLWAWGNNYYGQLGDGASTYISTPKQVLTGIKVPQ
jgi:alpha-tubulin suppressor-like RCC1 family protein